MQYMALIYADEGAWEALSGRALGTCTARYAALAEDARAAGVMVDGDELGPTRDATTVRVRDGQTLVTDGPYAEVKEALGGYFVFECAVDRRGGRLGRPDPGGRARRRRGAPRPRRSGGGLRCEYALLVYTDQSAWADLSEEEAARAARGVDAALARAVRGARQGRSLDGSGLELDSRGRGEGRPRPGRRAARHRRPVRRDEGAARRPVPHRAARPRRGDPARLARSRRRSTARSRSGRSASRPETEERKRVEQVFREEWAVRSSILIRVLGDFELAEDAVQDAFTTALERWPRDGVPRNPGAWIVTTARNRAIDRIRRERAFARKAELLARLEALPGGGGRREHDPGRSARARLHLLPPGARRRRAGRADAARGRRAHDRGDRARLPRRRADDGTAARAREAEDPRRRHPVPRAARPPAARPAARRARRALPRLQRGLRRDARARRTSAATSATRRSGSRKLLCVLMPDEPEALGLLALHAPPRLAARRARRRRTASSCCSTTRTGRSGTRREIDEGRRVLDRALALGGPGPYQLQAAIAAAHIAARRDRLETDRALYERLLGSSTDRPSCGSTARWRSRSPGRHGAGWRSSTRSSGSRGTTSSTPRAPTCCGASSGAAKPRGVPCGARADDERGRAALPRGRLGEVTPNT